MDSIFPDTLQPKNVSNEEEEKKPPNNERERRTSITSKDKALRLSVPIGRVISRNKEDDTKRKLSSVMESSSLILQSLDKEFSPLTPSHTLTRSHEKTFLADDEDCGDLTVTQSLLLRHLRKDSISTELSKETLKGDSETGQLYKEVRDDDSDEWKKLDILEDLGVMEEDEFGTEDEFELLLDEGEAPENKYLVRQNLENYDIVEGEASYTDIDEFSRDEVEEVSYSRRYLDYLKAQKTEDEETSGTVTEIENVEEMVGDLLRKTLSDVRLDNSSNNTNKENMNAATLSVKKEEVIETARSESSLVDGKLIP